MLVSGCANIHGCDLGGKFVCDPDGTNCRWEFGFNCKVGPPYPDPNPPYPGMNAASEPPSDIASLPSGAEETATVG